MLAAVGLTQYSRVVEKSRGAEARMTIGKIRKLAFDYALNKGTFTGFTQEDFNIGSSPGQLPGPNNPSSCRSTHYFVYQVSALGTPDGIAIYAHRCTSGGKTPQGFSYFYYTYFYTNRTDIGMHCGPGGTPNCTWLPY